MEPDAVPIAVELARELKRPVQVVVSQSSSQNHDRVAPGALARMTALPGAGGITAAWAMRVATADGLGSALARLGKEDRPASSGKARSTDRCRLIRCRTSRSKPFAPICPSTPATCADRRSANSLSSPKASSMSWRVPRKSSRWRSGCRCSGKTEGSRAASRARRGSRSGTEADPEARWGSRAAPPSARISAWSPTRASGATSGFRSIASSQPSIADASSTAASSRSRSRRG